MLLLIPVFGTFAANLLKMAKNTSVSLGDYFDAFINRKISEGRYKNVSEVIRAGLRLLEDEENKMIFISNALKTR